MALEYYEFLGIPQTADASEVKRAIFRKRKELAIAKDTYGQEYLNEVSRTLQDPQARAEYDALQEHGDAFSAIMDEASHAMEAANWADASRLLKQALLLVPDQPMVMNQLAMALGHQGNFTEANGLFNTLVKTHPQTALYWANHGGMLLDAAEITPAKASDTTFPCPNCREDNTLPTIPGLITMTCPSCNEAFRVNVGGRRDALLMEARFRIRKASELEPYNTGLHMAMAHSYEITRQFDNAQELVEQAISADGSEDMQDFEALLYLARLYAFDRKLDRINDIAYRVERILPVGEPDVREYAGQRFAHTGWQLARARAFETAVPFLQAAKRFLPQDEEIAKLLRACDGLHRAGQDFRLLTKDKQVIDSVKHACAFWLAENSGQFSEEEAQKRFNELINTLNAVPGTTLKSSLERLKTTYPNVYACGKEFFDEILTNIRRNAAARAAERNAPNESSGCSGGAIGGGGLGTAFLIYVIIRIILAIMSSGRH